MSSLLSKHVRKIHLSDSVVLPGDLVAVCLGRLGEGLQVLDFGNFVCRDEEIVAIGSSNASKTLKSLKIIENVLTDASSHVWSRFSSLEALHLDSLAYLGIKSVEEMAKLPLRAFSAGACGNLKLEGFLRAFKQHGTPLCSIELHPDSQFALPFIDIWPALEQQLLDWPARVNLEEVKLWTYGPQLGAVESILSHHNFFPSLKDVSISASIQRVLDPLPPCLKNITSLRLFDDKKHRGSMNQASVDTLARNLPLLTSLTTFTAGTVDLSEMKALKTLRSNFGCVSRFPPALRSLSLRLAAPRYFSASQYASTVEAVEAVAPTLENLHLAALPRFLLRRLLSLLPHLLSLWIEILELTLKRHESASETEEEQPTIVSHPKLQFVHLPGTCQLGFLPRLSLIDFNMWVYEASSTGTADARCNLKTLVPGLSTLRLTAPLKLETFERNLEQLPFLTQLDVAPGAPADFIALAKRLPRLTKVELREMGGSSGTCFHWKLAELLEALPALRELDLKQYRGDYTLPIGFKHPLLIKMAISERPKIKDGEANMFQILVIGENFPGLQLLRLAVRPISDSQNAWKIAVENMPRLASATFDRSSLAETRVDLAVTGCPLLTQIDVKDILFTKVKLLRNSKRCVPEFRYTMLPSDTSAVELDCTPKTDLGYF